MRQMMVGREIAENFYRTDYDGTTDGEVALKGEHITFGLLHDVSVELHRGEILGLGGLTDCGMHDLGKILFGIIKPDYGTVTLADGTQIKDTKQAVTRRMAYISKNRDTEALMSAGSITDNLCLASLPQMQKYGFVAPRKEKEMVAKWRETLSIKMQKRAMSSEDTIYVAAIGAPTNIASALLMEPELVKKIVVVWLGAQPLYFKHGIEFNSMQDVKASQVLFDSGVPLVLIPCMNTASMLTLAKPEVEKYLVGKSPICDYLAEIVLEALSGNAAAAAGMTTMMRHTYLASREDRDDSYLVQFTSDFSVPARIVWDISTIAFLKNPGWTPSILETSPIFNDDLSWGEKDDSRHKIRVVNFCHRDLIFGDMIACLTK